MKSPYFCFLDVEDQEEEVNEFSSEMTKKKFGKNIKKPEFILNVFLLSTILNYF
jgi:hypothetical protein